eukprot:CAMPEP_0118921058 /NCGR_PEP_ID=MMETSP1169-20130426/449_1 /TAXON_ID=36882 /ORGANISM="Pyramimonas obovata, Strain CCMP722" /LENGTH=156 /DNA_ID=CAMNT_0006861709 /DNA_START=138 /DNA_END=608 /DNA_ORIENTATION=+
MMVARSDVVLVALVVALFAAMPVANADCCSIESFMDIFSSCYAYHGSCGAFQTKSGCWSGGACYAMDEGSCCDTNGGAIAGLIIGLVVLVVAIVMCSCACCPCCPCHGKLCCGKRNGKEAPPQPVVQMNMAPIVAGQPVVALAAVPMAQPVQQAQI